MGYFTNRDRQQGIIIVLYDMYTKPKVMRSLFPLAAPPLDIFRSDLDCGWLKVVGVVLYGKYT
jgi:hypothetical protein